MKLDDYLGSSSSTNKGEGTRTRVYMTFSVGAKPVKVEEERSVTNFSEHPGSLLIQNEIASFSLRELIRQRKFLPKIVLRLRIREVANYCRSSSPDQIRESKDVIIPYIKEYVNRYILGAVNNPSVGNFNIVMLLGLGQIMRNTMSARTLQRILKITKRSYSSTGRLTPVIQKRLEEAYSAFWNDFITSIEEKYLPENKRGILSKGSVDSGAKVSTNVMTPSSDSISDEELDRVAFFSEKSNTISSPETFVAYLEGYLANLDDKDDPKSIIDKLNEIKKVDFCKNKSNAKKLLDKEIFGDEILTSYIVNYVFFNKNLVELTRYLKNSLSPKEVNFSIVTHPWGRIQWSSDHLECFVPSVNFKWYHFITENPNSDNVVVKCESYPISIPFKEVDKPDAEIKYGTLISTETFNNQLKADEYIMERIDRLMNKAYNFSQSSTPIKWNVVKETKDYTLGYYIIGSTRYETLYYIYDNKANIEVRKHPVTEDIELNMSKNVLFPIVKEIHGASPEEAKAFMKKFEDGDIL